MSNTIQNVRTIAVKYLAPTNYLGSRVKLSDPYFKDNLTLSYCYESGCIKKQAVKYLEEQGFKVLSTSFWKVDECLITVDNFSPNCLDLKGISRD